MQTYYLTPRFKFISKIVFLVFITIQTGIFLWLFQSSTCLIIYALVLGIFYFYSNFHALNDEYLVLDDKAIEYHRRGSIFEIKWSDAEAISPRWFIWGKQDSLIVDKSKVKIQSMSTFGASYLTRIFNLQETFVPLSCFSENWRNSDLGQQIKQHVPHLFEKEKSAQSA
ncbi:MAG: hypothetical protein HZB19_15385 [Chloroflexi bacterium]|nr:hypothetical protein [Chloroflexota bacterium]